MAVDEGEESFAAAVAYEEHTAHIASLAALVSQDVVEEDFGGEGEYYGEDAEEREDHSSVVGQAEHDHAEEEHGYANDVLDDVEYEDIAVGSAAVDLIEFERGLGGGPYYGYEE